MIFVVEAIGRRWCGRFVQRIAPVLASTRIAEGAFLSAYDDELRGQRRGLLAPTRFPVRGRPVLGRGKRRRRGEDGSRDQEHRAPRS
jgi:hypothetical protein